MDDREKLDRLRTENEQLRCALMGVIEVLDDFALNRESDRRLHDMWFSAWAETIKKARQGRSPL